MITFVYLGLQYLHWIWPKCWKKNRHILHCQLHILCSPACFIKKRHKHQSATSAFYAFTAGPKAPETEGKMIGDLWARLTFFSHHLVRAPLSCNRQAYISCWHSEALASKATNRAHICLPLTTSNVTSACVTAGRWTLSEARRMLGEPTLLANLNFLCRSLIYLRSGLVSTSYNRHIHLSCLKLQYWS